MSTTARNARRRRQTRLGLLVLLCLTLPALATTRILLTLEWPPYTSLSEPGGGSITTLVNKVFAAMGDTTRVGYFSWHRVLQLPRTDRRFAASYPMYYSDQRAERCWFSDPIGEGPVGLAEPKANPISWQKVDDLRAYHVGVVRGYVNTPEFDQQVSEGEIITLAGESDAENLRNLLAGRVRVAIVDVNTFGYMNGHEPTLAGMTNTLQINPHLLTVNKVYMCFPKDQAGLELRDNFNKTMKTLNLPMPGRYEGGGKKGP